MIFSRILLPPSSYKRIVMRLFSQNISFVKEKQLDEQINYLKSVIENNTRDWTIVKNDIMSIRGNVNHKNIDAIMLKHMVSSRNFDVALSFAQHLKSTSEELSLGTINGLLGLYYEMGMANKLSEEQTQFILDTHKGLRDKYKVLDYSTCERLLHALCVINEGENGLKLLDDIHVTTVPTHSAYSTLIATFFRLNKKKKAFELIAESIRYKRPLLENAYDEWINYILRKYKDKKTIAKYMDEVFYHVAKNCAVIPVNTANKLKELYSSLKWNAQFAIIRKMDGQCSCCKDTLNSLFLTDEEFNSLQQNVKQKLIVGSDLFLKTSPDELKRFLDFVEGTAPYDVVLDGLNIAYAVGVGSHKDKLNLLNYVVDHFVSQRKKVLLLGRRHMMTWHRKTLQTIMNKTCFFFTENISQDDPYFITAALLSGPHTDIVSKDLLRGHQFQLKDESLRHLFKRWQWQHQSMVFLSKQRGPIIQPPLKFTPCAQKKENSWHLPFDRDTVTASPQINDGTPDLFSWLCLRHDLK